MAEERIAAGPATAFDVHVTGRRVLSIIADGLVLGVVFSAMSLLARMMGIGEAEAPLFAGYTWAGGFFVLAMAYYALMEGYRGQTLGKMLFGIRVVREDGGVPGFKAALIRSLLRIVDGLFGYLVGFLAVLASGKNQRLGDMAAHTLVVREQ